MAETQTIIVYRNQYEKDFYEHNGPINLIMFIFVMIISFLILYQTIYFIGKKLRKWESYNVPNWIVGFSLIVSTVIGIFTIYKYGF